MNGQQGALINFLVPIVFLVMFYFLLIRPNQKREKAIKEMRASLKTGDHIMTIGGIGGRIVSVDEATVVLEVAPDNIKIVVEKWGIGRKAEFAQETDEATSHAAEEEAMIEERILEANELENEE